MALLRFLLIPVLGTLLVLLLLAGSNVWTYQRLVHEQAIGTLHFSKIDKLHYSGSFIPLAGEKHSFVLAGDEWQLDSKVIKWQASANLLGFDTIFKLDRISGRYSNANIARKNRPTVYSFNNDTFDVWQLAKEYPSLFSMIDAHYGSSVFLPMLDGQEFMVSITQSGLIARQQPMTAFSNK